MTPTFHSWDDLVPMSGFQCRSKSENDRESLRFPHLVELACSLRGLVLNLHSELVEDLKELMCAL